MTVETRLEPGPTGHCEDVILVSGHIYGVFDGGISAATAASEVFGDRTSATLAELSESAQKHVDEAIGVRSAKGLPTEGLGLAVIRIEKKGIDWVYGGKTEILIILPDGSHEHPSATKNNEARIQSGQRKLQGIRHILLFTDGLLSQSKDIPKLIENFLNGGLKTIPTKDDTAAIAISFLPPNPARVRKKKKTEGTRGAAPRPRWGL